MKYCKQGYQLLDELGRNDEIYRIRLHLACICTAMKNYEKSTRQVVIVLRDLENSDDPAHCSLEYICFVSLGLYLIAISLIGVKDYGNCAKLLSQSIKLAKASLAYSSSFIARIEQAEHTLSSLLKKSLADFRR